MARPSASLPAAFCLVVSHCVRVLVLCELVRLPWSVLTMMHSVAEDAQQVSQIHLVNLLLLHQIFTFSVISISYLSTYLLYSIYLPS